MMTITIRNIPCRAALNGQGKMRSVVKWMADRRVVRIHAGPRLCNIEIRLVKTGHTG